MRQYQEGLLGLSLEIAQKVLDEAVMSDASLMRPLVQKAVASVKNAEWISVEVSSRLPGLVEELKKELAGRPDLPRTDVMGAELPRWVPGTDPGGDPGRLGGYPADKSEKSGRESIGACSAGPGRRQVTLLAGWRAGQVPMPCLGRFGKNFPIPQKWRNLARKGGEAYGQRQAGNRYFRLPADDPDQRPVHLPGPHR